MSDRCEPPEEWRKVYGWHWVGKPGEKFSEKPHRWEPRGKWTILGHGSPETAYAHDWRYLCPVPTPSDLAAAKEREAALVDVLREIAVGFVDTQPNLRLSSMQLAARHALDIHAKGWRNTP